MGYSYWFAISLLSLPNNQITKYEILKPEKFTEFFIAEYGPHFRNVYNTLQKEDSWMPEFGNSSWSGSKGYSVAAQTKTNEKFEQNIKKFTTAFPEFTFGIYLFYWDNTEFIFWKIQNNHILETVHVPEKQFNLSLIHI